MNEWLWENVFKRYQSYIKNLNEVDRQERQLNVAIWLRGVSARPPGRGELILACLLDFWASSNTSARFRSEIIATSRFVVDSINDDDASSDYVARHSF